MELHSKREPIVSQKIMGFANKFIWSKPGLVQTALTQHICNKFDSDKLFFYPSEPLEFPYLTKCAKKCKIEKLNSMINFNINSNIDRTLNCSQQSMELREKQEYRRRANFTSAEVYFHYWQKYQ